MPPARGCRSWNLGGTRSKSEADKKKCIGSSISAPVLALGMWHRCSVVLSPLLVLMMTIACASAREPSILLAMIARNEEDNFRANLPLWKPVIDGVICGVDDRTSDRTHLAIVETLSDLPRCPPAFCACFVCFICCCLGCFVCCGHRVCSPCRSPYFFSACATQLIRWIYYYRFDGFGAARTRVFQEAWRKFPNMSHVLVADPDWEPVSPKKSEVDFNHIVSVVCHDRSWRTG